MIITTVKFGEGPLGIDLCENEEKRGVVVGLVRAGGQAEAGGVVPWSVIVGLNGEDVRTCSKAELTQRLANAPRPHVELLLMMILAMAAYTGAEAVECSGILALFVCAVLMQHYTWYNLSAPAQASSSVAFKTLSTVCEAALSMLGIANSESECKELMAMIDVDGDNVVSWEEFLGFGALLLNNAMLLQRELDLAFEVRRPVMAC